MKRDHGRYISALRFRSLTCLYDPVVAATAREATFKDVLVALSTMIGAREGDAASL